MKSAKVFLVGAGPGDPELITLKGLKVLKQADFIIYDYLVNEKLLEHASPNAEKIYVGKKKDFHLLPQEDINKLIIEYAQKGGLTVRLKGGDPFVLGRGGEEAETLVEHNIPFEIIPGITSAVAVPAYAGIPVTHRDFSSSVTIITGHRKNGHLEYSINWPCMAQNPGTLVFLMGVTNLPMIVSKLLKHGKPPSTPVALISWGTWPNQKTCTGILTEIVSKAQQEEVRPPAVIVVGEVVKLSEKLGKWFIKNL